MRTFSTFTVGIRNLDTFKIWTFLVPGFQSVLTIQKLLFPAELDRFIQKKINFTTCFFKRVILKPEQIVLFSNGWTI
jgi:hypothetical protein